MNYPKIDFLERNERRFQGAVSRRFIVLASIGTPLLLLAVLIALQLMHARLVKSNLEVSRQILKELQPRLSTYNKEKAQLETVRKVVGLYDNWSASGASLDELMVDVQDAVPANIQLSRLDFELRNGGSRIYQSAEELVSTPSMILHGFAHGQRGESEVISLHKKMMESQLVETMFEEVRLAAMRKRKGRDEARIREFTLQCGKLKGGAK